MSRLRRRVLNITFLCAAFAVVAGFAIQSHAQARHYQRLLSNRYTHAFTELTTAAQELTSALRKASYTTPGPLQKSLYEQVYAKALAAQYALGEVPLEGDELEQTAAFFAKAGDYAAALTRDGDDRASAALGELAAAAQTVSAALDAVQLDLDAGIVTLAEAARQVDGVVSDGAAPAGGTAFQSVEADFPELPTLIYDGPFSEHLSSETPRALEGLPEVTQSEAKQAAAAFLQRSPNALTLVSAGEGVLPTYAFSVTQDGGAGYVEVTRQGGRILSYFRDYLPPVTGARLSVPEVVELAQNYLAAWGFAQMEPSYTLTREGALTIHFAPVTDGVYCYPDLVKVTLSLADGSLIGYEAHGYLSRHTARELAPPTVSQETASAALPGELTVLSAQLALIPTGGGTDEVLTYEFKCAASDGSHVLVYVNAQTGLQQNILLLLEDDTGTLTL